MFRNSYLLVCGLLALVAFQTSCEDFGSRSSLNDCPPCPNNTTCFEGDCGCRTDQIDMGSWCLPKRENLFVAASLDCPCLDAVGLYLMDIQPETGNGSLPLSSYDLVGRGKLDYNTQSNFTYYQRPDGDSIVLYNITIPGSAGYSACWINSSLNCELDLFGKFHGPDTIETKVLYRRCRDKDNNPSNFQETKQLTFIRRQ